MSMSFIGLFGAIFACKSAHRELVPAPIGTFAVLRM